MKSWIKYGLAGALILVASFWGGSVRAAQMPLGPDDALPGQIVAQAAALPTVTVHRDGVDSTNSSGNG